MFGRGSRVRTRDLRFWRPSLYQLSYTPMFCRVVTRGFVTMQGPKWLHFPPRATQLFIVIAVIGATRKDMMQAGMTILAPSANGNVLVASVVQKQNCGWHSVKNWDRLPGAYCTAATTGASDASGTDFVSSAVPGPNQPSSDCCLTKYRSTALAAFCVSWASCSSALIV